MAVLAEYGFNEGIGLHAWDSSNNGRSLVATNAATSWDSEGGRTEIVGQPGPNTSQTNWTMMAWVKRTGTWTGFASAFGKASCYVEASSASSYQLNFYGGTNSNTTSGAGNQLTLNTWVHVAVTRDASGTKLFVNGVQQGSQVANAAQNFGSGNWGVALTAATAANDATFAGTVKDFRTFDTALDAATITTHMNTEVTAVGVAFVGATSGAPAGAASFQVTLPSGYAANDRAILTVTGKYNTTTVPTINQGWTLLKSGTGGTGATGQDTGQVFWAVYGKDLTSGSETAPTVTAGATAPNSWEWELEVWRDGVGWQWTDTITTNAAWVQSASDTNTASPLTGTAGAFTGVQPTNGDAITCTGVVPTDLGTALGATTITATGLSAGRITAATSQYVENALGFDTAMVWAMWQGFAGTASAGVALSFTITSNTNHSGAVIAVALRTSVAAGGVVTGTATGVFGFTASATGTVVPAGGGGGGLVAVAKTTYSTSGATPRTTAAFNVLAGDILVCGSVVENGNNNYAATPVTNNGAALTWAPKQTIDYSADQCMCGMWTTTVDADRTGMTVTVTLTANSIHDVIVWIYRGAGVSIGASSKTDNGPVGNSAPSLALVTTQDGSDICVVNADWAAVAGARTYRQVNGANPTEDLYVGTAGSDYIAHGYHYVNAGTAGSKTVGLTAPATQRYTTIAVEVKITAGTPEVTGTATGVFGFSAPATGESTSIGTATGIFGFSAPATGVTIAEGVATGVFGFTASAAGVPVRLASSATGVFGFSAPSSGVPARLGSATGVFGFSSTATGERTVTGSATGVFGFSGPTTGQGYRLGTATGDFGFASSAAGSVAGAVEGTATGAFGFSAPVAGQSVRLGDATSSFGFSGPSTGQGYRLGTAVSSFGFNAPASGTRIVTGAATGSFGFSAEAAGQGSRLGTATGSFGFSAPATGQQISPITGTATGVFGFTAAAQGVSISIGTATGVFGFSAPAAGVPVRPGTATGLFGFAASAAGSPVRHGTASGVFGFAAPASGVGVTPGQGTATGEFGFTANAQGTPIRLGSGTAVFGFTASGQGITIRLGTGTGVFGFLAAASGTRIPPVTGTATALFGFTASATGTVSAGGVVTGTAAGVFGFLATAVGQLIRLGQASGVFGFGSVAQGVVIRFGTATGLFGFTSTAAGTGSAGPVVFGTASGVFGFDGPAQGVLIRFGTGTAVFGFLSTATGSIIGAVGTLGTATGDFGFTAVAVGVGAAPPPYMRPRPRSATVLLGGIGTQVNGDLEYESDVTVFLGAAGSRISGDADYAQDVVAAISDHPDSTPGILLEDDQEPAEEEMMGDLLLIGFTIRTRTRVGYDDDGNAMYEWSDLVSGNALKWEKREEFDSDAGITYTHGELLLSNPADIPVTEAAVAVDQSNGEVWRIRKVKDLPESTRFEMERLDA